MKLIHTYTLFLPFSISRVFHYKQHRSRPDSIRLLCFLLIFTSFFLQANHFDPIAGAKNHAPEAVFNGECYIKFPNDTIVTHCNSTGVYGKPEFGGGNGGQLLATYQDQILHTVTDACFRIERTWFVRNEHTFDSTQSPLCITVPNPQPEADQSLPINRLGPIVSPVQDPSDPWKSTIVKIAPSDSVATNYSVFYDPNANCYYYKQIISVLDTTDPVVHCPQSPSSFCDYSDNDSTLWKAAYWWDTGNQSHDLCEAPVEICITATDSCSGGNLTFEYHLYLDLNNDGTMETVVKSNELGAQPNGLGWNNILYGNTQGVGEQRSFDFRPVPDDQKWGFALEQTVSGNSKTACVKFNTQANPNTYVPAQLPLGTHKIKWYVSDGCGNEKICEYVITVKDCKAPVVVCQSGLVVDLPIGQKFTLHATDCLHFSTDNCSLTPYLQYGIRKCDFSNSGFPLDNNGNPITNVMFDCSEIGTQCVELWAMDMAGNSDKCERYVVIQDNAHNCPGTNGIHGKIETSQNDGVEDVTVMISGPSIIFFPPIFQIITTDSTGAFNINVALPLVSAFVVTPEKDDDPLNGVTTYDLVLISKHILATDPLYDPYSLIAADANKSNSITTFDIVELRKLILGIYQHLPANKSWRFVSKAQVFHNPNNPFADTLQESITLGYALANLPNLDFIGIKIGDVNNTVIAHHLTAPDNRSAGRLYFDVNDRNVEAGEAFDLRFQSAEKNQGFQMTLDLNGLKVLALPDEEQVNADNFGVFADPGHPGTSALTVSVNGAESFTVKFRAEKAGKLSEMLEVSSRITPAEAYSMTDDRLEVALRFNRKTGAGFELYQNEPNPFVNKTSIGFHLPEPTTATLTVCDETGRVVFTQKGEYAKGYNAISLDRALLNAPGLLSYTLETPTHVATRKMIQAK